MRVDLWLADTDLNEFKSEWGLLSHKEQAKPASFTGFEVIIIAPVALQGLSRWRSGWRICL